MGSASYRKIIVLALLFALTSVFIYWQPSSRVVKKDEPLSQALLDIEGWNSNGVIPLEKEIVKGLELDEYANQSYSNGHETVFLYIGYYLSKKKLGAAHDPLVCFPGQGWAASEIRKGSLTLEPGADGSVSYSTMTVERGLRKEFILYWYQSYDRTSGNTFYQKLIALRQKVFHQPEDNAFIRISIPVEGRSLDECREIIFKFMRSFYPAFLQYVRT
jgi:EpsI family protein